MQSVTTHFNLLVTSVTTHFTVTGCWFLAFFWFVATQITCLKLYDFAVERLWANRQRVLMYDCETDSWPKLYFKHCSTQGISPTTGTLKINHYRLITDHWAWFLWRHRSILSLLTASILSTLYWWVAPHTYTGGHTDLTHWRGKVMRHMYN